MSPETKKRVDLFTLQFRVAHHRHTMLPTPPRRPTNTPECASSAPARTPECKGAWTTGRLTASDAPNSLLGDDRRRLRGPRHDCIRIRVLRTLKCPVRVRSARAGFVNDTSSMPPPRVRWVILFVDPPCVISHLAPLIEFWLLFPGEPEM